MFASAFRFDTSRLHAAFAPRKPRNPLLRLLAGLLGVFVGTAMLLAGLGMRLARNRNRPAARPRGVVEGEYRIVGKSGLPLAR